MVSRRNLLKSLGASSVAGAGIAGAASRGNAHQGGSGSHQGEWHQQTEPEPYEEYNTHEVPDDFDTIQGAVDAAEPQDLILVNPGVYKEEVEVNDTPEITIRGTDRNEVIIDGEFSRYTGITVTADDVVIENMTSRNHNANGFYWTGVDGYRGSYLTAYNNVEYGIYSFDSINGRFEHSYASGCDDAGFYIGQSKPAHAVIDNIIAENNAMGYSGTNAGGNLTIKNSTWRNNICGITPNTLDSQQFAPQAGVRMVNNEIHRNNNINAPAYPLAYAGFGNGILVAGGTKNLIENNTVTDQARFGIAITPILENNFWRPADNTIRNNDVSNSGRADLALGGPAAGGNVFSNNKFDKSRPMAIESRDGSIGDFWVTALLFKHFIQGMVSSYPRGEVKNMPEPPEQPDMPDTSQAPRPSIGGWTN